MTAKVVSIRPADNPDVVLEAAKGNVEHVLVMGYDHDGEMYVASSPYFADGGNMLWLLETVKQRLLDLEWME